jgi:hypothetical protein
LFLFFFFFLSLTLPLWMWSAMALERLCQRVFCVCFILFFVLTLCSF